MCGPQESGAVIWPGTPPSLRPRLRAASAVSIAPEPIRAATTTVMSASAAMIRLRAGNIHRRAGTPGPSSDTTAPAARISVCSSRPEGG